MGSLWLSMKWNAALCTEHYSTGDSQVTVYILLAILMCIFDVLRGHLWSGIVWGTLGYSWQEMLIRYAPLRRNSSEYLQVSGPLHLSRWVKLLQVFWAQAEKNLYLYFSSWKPQCWANSWSHAAVRMTPPACSFHRRILPNTKLQSTSFCADTLSWFLLKGGGPTSISCD